HRDARAGERRHPQVLGLERLVGVVAEAVDTHDDAAAIVEVRGEHRVLAHLERLEPGEPHRPSCPGHPRALGQPGRRRLRGVAHSSVSTASSVSSSWSALAREKGMGGRILRMLSAGPMRLSNTPRSRMAFTVRLVSAVAGSLEVRSRTISTAKNKTRPRTSPMLAFPCS